MYKEPHYITYNGQTKTIAEWAREYGLLSGTLSYRINNGWPIEKAITQPLAPKARLYEYKGQLYTAAELAHINGKIATSTMQQRLSSGMTVEEAVEEPNKRIRRKVRITEERQKQVFKPIEKKVDTSLCRTCIYHGSLTGGGGEKFGKIYCDYIEIMLERRPCPPGKDCTVYKKGKSIVRKMALKRYGKRVAM